MPKHAYVDDLKGLKNDDDMFAYLSPGHLHVKSYTLIWLAFLFRKFVNALTPCPDGFGALDDAKYAFCQKFPPVSEH